MPELRTLTAPSGKAEEAGDRLRVEELPRWRRRLTLALPASEVARERERLTREYARRMRLPGFRPGHAPVELVRKRLGAEVEDELVRNLLRRLLREAFEERGIEPISSPAVHSLEIGSGGDLRGVVEVDVRPELRLSRLSGFRVEPVEPRVEPDAVERVLERLREERAEVRAVERPAARGDVVVADVEPVDGEGQPVSGYEVRLGSGDSGPEIEAQLEGVEAGAERDVEAQGRRWRVRVQEVRERLPPALDDAFAAAVSPASTLAGLRERIAENLRLEAEALARRQARERLVEAVVEANSVEVPESMVERYVERMLSPAVSPGTAVHSGTAHAHGHPEQHAGPRGGPGDPAHGHAPEERVGASERGRSGAPARDPELERILREAAERSLRRLLVVEAVARSEGLEPSEDQIDAYLGERVEPGTGVDETRRALERTGRLEELRAHLRAENVFRFLENQSNLRPPDDLTSRAEPTR